MREDIKKVVEKYKKEQAELKKQEKMEQLMDYMLAIGYYNKEDVVGIGRRSTVKTEEYRYEVDGLFYKEVSFSVDLTDEELKELYAALPPEEVLKAKKVEKKKKSVSSANGLRSWSVILTILSIIAAVVLIIAGAADDEGAMIACGIGVLLLFLPLSSFYKTVAGIADAVIKPE